MELKFGLQIIGSCRRFKKVYSIPVPGSIGRTNHLSATEQHYTQDGEVPEVLLKYWLGTCCKFVAPTKIISLFGVSKPVDPSPDSLYSKSKMPLKNGCITKVATVFV